MKNKEGSLVSFVIPVYNGEKYLGQTIRSILNQTYKNFELIIVNDKSPDSSEDIIIKYLNKDERIKYIKNEKNLGISETTNRGIDEARGKYIAMTDQDDISYPNRIRVQVDFLDKYPSYNVIGSVFDLIDENDKVTSDFKPPLTKTEYKWWLSFTSPFTSVSVMIRRKALVDNGLRFRSEYNLVQDYDMWSRLGDFGEGINLEEKLVAYREHNEQNSLVKNRQQQELAARISLREFEKYINDYAIKLEDVKKARQFFYICPENPTKEDIGAIRLIHQLAEKFYSLEFVDKKIFAPILRYWREQAKKISHLKI